MSDAHRLGAPVAGSYRDLDAVRPVLHWRLPEPMLAVASAPIGGGIGVRQWIVNAQVPRDYDRIDLDAHLAAIAAELGCTGSGVGFLTAAPVDRVTTAHDEDVVAYATVGLRHPTWAADAENATSSPGVGTINVVVGVPRRLVDAALVNAVITATEAKTQALLEADVPGTGTASDAVCVVCPTSGDADAFAGPRSPLGGSLARAVHAAVAAGTARAWPVTEEGS
jgi:adenosylcobinamide amidohydrolase